MENRTATTSSAQISNSSIKARVQLWLDQARHAPSADNTQPWIATVAHSQGLIRVTLEVSPETLAQASEVDANFTTSYMALGALAKNLEIVALADGYALSQVQPADFKFELSFKRTEAQVSPLRSWIFKRHTNRNAFAVNELSSQHLELLKDLQGQIRTSQIDYTPRTLGQNLIKALGQLDALRYVNKKLFFDFISKMRFGSEVFKTKDGLAGPTLGVPLVARASLWIMKSLKFMWRLNFLGIQHASAWMGATRLLNRSAGLITLQASEDTPLAWFQLGADMQQTWMALNANGISVQPFGTPLLIYRAYLEEQNSLTSHDSLFASEKRKSLLALGEDLKTHNGIDCTLPLIVLRVGYAPQAPAMRALRRAHLLTETLELRSSLNDIGETAEASNLGQVHS
jgi:hypothetical protein